LLDEEEKISILLKAAPPEYYRDIKMQETSSSHFKSMESAVKFLTQLHEAAQFEKKMNKFNEHKCKHGSDAEQELPKKQYKGDKSSHQYNNNHDRSGIKKCSNCGKPGHLDSDCWYKEENQKKRPSGWGPSKDGCKNHKSNRDHNKSNKYKGKTKEAHMMNDSKLEAILSKVYEHGRQTERESKAKAPSKCTHFKRDDYDADSESDDSFGSHHFMTNEALHHDRHPREGVHYHWTRIR